MTCIICTLMFSNAKCCKSSDLQHFFVDKERTKYPLLPIPTLATSQSNLTNQYH